MNLYDLIEEHLKREEGFRFSAYQDSEGFLTIGYGRMIDKRLGGGITKQEASYLLDNDIQNVEQELDDYLEWFDELDTVRQAVLVSMAFQMGVRGLMLFERTLGYVKKGLYAEASEEMLFSRWAQQTPGRARRLSNAMYTGSETFLL